MKDTKIQWATNTFNAWMGCRKVAPECDRCYITRTPPFRFRKLVHGNRRIRTSENYWKDPLRWNKRAQLELSIGTMRDRPRVFCLSLGDWLDTEVPVEWLLDLLHLIYQTQNLDWLLLTKRPQMWRKRLYAALQRTVGDPAFPVEFRVWLDNWLRGEAAPDNVWLGVSAGVDPEPILDAPAVVHFLSCEPMLNGLNTIHAPRFKWIIFGGESDLDKQPRPFDVINLDLAIRFCEHMKIPVFVKQMGGHPTYHHDLYSDGTLVTNGWAKHVTFPMGCEIKLRDSHGGDWDEWPERFKVRDFPVLTPLVQSAL